MDWESEFEGRWGGTSVEPIRNVVELLGRPRSFIFLKESSLSMHPLCTYVRQETEQTHIVGLLASLVERIVELPKRSIWLGPAGRALLIGIERNDEHPLSPSAHTIAPRDAVLTLLRD